MSNASAEGSPAADREMPDVPRNPWQKRAERTMGNACLETNVTGKRANAQLATVLAYIIERIDAIDVDEVRGAGEPKIHRWHEALPAGKDLSFLTVCSEKIERIVNGAGRKIFKRDGFHQRSAAPKRCLLLTLNDLSEKSSVGSKRSRARGAPDGVFTGLWRIRGAGFRRANVS